MRLLLFFFIFTLFSARSFGAEVASLTGDIPKDTTNRNYFDITIVVKNITQKGYELGEANNETYIQTLQLYIGGGDSPSDVLSFSDNDETVKFWVDQANETEKVRQEDDDRLWTFTYSLTIRAKSNQSDALTNALDSSGQLNVSVEFFLGKKDENEYEQSSIIKAFPLEQSNYALDSKPVFSKIAAVGTHEQIIVYFESPTSLNRTDGKTLDSTSLNIIALPSTLLSKYRTAGLPGRTFNADADSDDSITCTFQPDDAASCVECGANGYVDVAALDSDFLRTATSSKNSSATIAGLTNRAEYQVFMQYEPTGIQQTACVSATPSKNTTYTEYNGEGEGKAEAIRCFIATAAYGSPYNENITLFRQFRDEVLLKTPWGQAAVNTYYTLSPPLANFIAKHESLRLASQWVLAVPAKVLELIYE